MIHEPPNHEPDIDPQGLWQSQKKEYDPMTLADIHQKARKFESKIQRRNAIEFVACGVVIVGFAPALFLQYHWLTKVGAAWIMLATVFIAWQLHKRASVDAPAGTGETLVEAYRRQLMRQRDAVRSMGTWYLAPMIPGFVLLQAGFWLGTPRAGVPIERVHTNVLIMLAVWIVLCAGIWLLNQWGAKRLQKKIDEL
jgi:hypothetical protein